MFEVSDTMKIGIGLIGFGIFFLILGVILFFDSALLAMGNILFVAGVSLMIGLSNTFTFFFGAKKIKGSTFFFGGIFTVLIGWPVIGMLVESVGLFYLFARFIPNVIGLLQNVPVISSIFYLPGVSSIVDKLTAAKLPV
eukprot:m.48929 g.48929  ORF g.48929 m.48929 type:complete len:139 (-) comp20892_c0_seq2:99-515(-)